MVKFPSNFVWERIFPNSGRPHDKNGKIRIPRWWTPRCWNYLHISTTGPSIFWGRAATILPPFVVKKLIDVFSGLCLTFHLAFPLLPLQRDGTVAVFYIKICCNISSASYHNKTFSIVSSVFPPRLSINRVPNIFPVFSQYCCVSPLFIVFI